MRKPLHSFFNLGNVQPKKPTFGEARAEKLNTRMITALKDRQKFARAEAASDDPLKTTYFHKGSQEERKIDRLTAELSDAKK